MNPSKGFQAPSSRLEDHATNNVRRAVKAITESSETMLSNEHAEVRTLKNGIKVYVHIIDKGNAVEVYCISEFGDETTVETLVPGERLEDVIGAQLLELERDIEIA